MGLTHSPLIVTDGLIACFDPANPRGKESSSALINFAPFTNTNSLAIYNGATFDDRNGGVMSFDGTNDAAVVNDYDALNAVTSSVSLSSWFYLNGLPGGETPLIRKDDQWAIQMLSSTSIRCLVKTTGGTTGWTGDNDVTFNFATGRWYNMTMTWDGSYMRIYMDAVLIKTASVTGTLNTNSNQTRIAARSRYLNGYMGNVLINSTGLTGDEVRRNYEATKGRYQ